MKVTGNEVEVAKHSSVITPLLLLLLLLLLFCWVATARAFIVIPSSAPAIPLSTTRYGLNVKGCLFQTSKSAAMIAEAPDGRKDDGVKLNEQR